MAPVGAVLLATVAAGKFADIEQATPAMPRTIDTIDPDPSLFPTYDRAYEHIASCSRCSLHSTMREIELRPLFESPISVGVANVFDFAADIPSPPNYVCEGRGAGGFAELADMLIAAKD